MALYTIQNGQAVRWRGEPINGMLHPLAIERLWAEVDLNAIGLYTPLPADAIPDGMVSTKQTVQIANGVPKYAHVLVPAPSEIELIAQAEADADDLVDVDETTLALSKAVVDLVMVDITGMSKAEVRTAFRNRIAFYIRENRGLPTS